MRESFQPTGELAQAKNIRDPPPTTHRLQMAVVARFEIPYTQFIDLHGKAVQPLPAFARDTATLVALYRWRRRTPSVSMED